MSEVSVTAGAASVCHVYPGHKTKVESHLTLASTMRKDVLVCFRIKDNRIKQDFTGILFYLQNYGEFVFETSICIYSESEGPV